MKKIIIFLYKLMVFYSIVFTGVIIYIFYEGNYPKESSLYFVGLFDLATMCLYFILKYKKIM